MTWGGRGDRARLHVVACAYMVARRGQGPSCPPAGWAADVVSSSAGRRARGVRRAAGRENAQAAQRAHGAQATRQAMQGRRRSGRPTSQAALGR